MIKTILCFIIAVTLSACGREEGKSGSPSSNQNSSVSETLPKISSNCTSTADYELGIKNGLKMAPPCENPAFQAESYKMVLKVGACEQWLQSETNSSKFKVTLKNESAYPIRLVGKLGFRNSKDELLAEWTMYPSNSLLPKSDTIEEVTLSVSCQEINEVTLSSIDNTISKVDEKQITAIQVQAVRKDFQILFNPNKSIKDVSTPAIQSAQTGSESPQYDDANDYSECSVVTSLMGNYMKTTGDTATADKLFRYALVWGNTAFEIAERRGMSRDQIINKNKAVSERYNMMLKDFTNNNTPLSEYADIMDRKMNYCANLLKSRPDLRLIFQSYANR